MTLSPPLTLSLIISLYIPLFLSQNLYSDVPPQTKPPPCPKPCIDPCKIDLSRVCTLEYDPVCGCNNITYSNYCFAEREGVTKWKVGECPILPSTPIPTFQPTLKPTEKCIDIGQINLQLSCPRIRIPVCGCDGKTYKNKCSAFKHGILRWTNGEC